MNKVWLIEACYCHEGCYVLDILDYEPVEFYKDVNGVRLLDDDLVRKVYPDEGNDYFNIVEKEVKSRTQ